MTDISELCVGPECELHNVMLCIDRNAKRIALVVDQENRLLGAITDGDIRRAILQDLDLNTSAADLLARKRDSAYPHPITALENTDKASLIRLLHEHSVQHIPLLDEQGRVVDLVTIDDLVSNQITRVQAVIMAGGFGKRLRPLTDDLPKPMLPVGDRPLLERIIEQLRVAGIQQVNITTHYRPEKITDYFGDGERFGVELNYVSEDTPLGTAGALGLMDRPQDPLLVMNGDILTQIDFRAMLDYHQEQGADLTVAVRQYEFQVPYGVLECDGPIVRQLREKPSFRFFVNAGVYLLQPSVYDYIPFRKPLDMPDLIQALIEQDRPVVSFPVVEYWLDVGQHDDYQQAIEDINHGRIES